MKKGIINAEDLYYRTIPKEVREGLRGHFQTNRYDGEDKYFNDFALRSNAAGSEIRKYLSYLGLERIRKRLKPAESQRGIAENLRFICRGVGLTDMQADDLVSSLAENIDCLFR
jgi:hypothetical protein